VNIAKHATFAGTIVWAFSDPVSFKMKITIKIFNTVEWVICESLHATFSEAFQLGGNEMSNDYGCIRYLSGSSQSSDQPPMHCAIQQVRVPAGMRLQFDGFQCSCAQALRCYFQKHWEGSFLCKHDTIN
jgi:hypothetical protein